MSGDIATQIPRKSLPSPRRTALDLAADGPLAARFADRMFYRRVIQRVADEIWRRPAGPASQP